MSTTRTLISNLRLLGLVLCGFVLSACSQPDGPYETFHDNGQLSFRGNIVDGEPNGLFEYFHDNGQLEFRGDVVDGKGEGLFETFHENGQLRLRGNNVDGETDGLSEYFDEDGNLTETRMYRNGELVETNSNP